MEIIYLRRIEAKYSLTTSKKFYSYTLTTGKVKVKCAIPRGVWCRRDAHLPVLEAVNL